MNSGSKDGGGNHHRRDGKAHSDDGVGVEWKEKKERVRVCFSLFYFIAYVFYVINSRIWTDHRVKTARTVTYFVYVCDRFAIVTITYRILP